MALDKKITQFHLFCKWERSNLPSLYTFYMTNSHSAKEKFNFPKDEFNFWPCSSLLPMNPLPYIYFHNKILYEISWNFSGFKLWLTFFSQRFLEVEIVSLLFQYQPMNWLLWQLHLQAPFEVQLLSWIASKFACM